MKKILFLLIPLFLSIQSFAQLDFGLRGGVTTSKLYSNISDYNSDNILGYHGGAFLRVFVGKHPFIQPEAYYCLKGGDLLNSVEQKQYEIKINSLDIPLLVGVKFLDLKITKLTVYGGPVLSFISQKSVNYYEDGIQVIPPDPETQLKNSSWGVQAGASLDVLILTLDIRHEWGLTDLLENSETELKSGVWLIGLGIRLF